MRFFERFIYKKDGVFEWLLFAMLAPIGWIYCLVSLATIRSSSQKEFGIPIIGVGNLVVGGSGKTPLTAHLARRYPRSAVVLRGYKRSSKGSIVVAHDGKILVDVQSSGDEAMLYAKLLPNSTIIVSENRSNGIKIAKDLGSTVVFLDDSFRHRQIKKFDILIRPLVEPQSNLCLPASAYRQPKNLYNLANLVIKEGIDYKRSVTLQHPTQKMVLITSIAKPERLDPYLPASLLGKYYFADHHMFNRDEIQSILQKSGADSIVTTVKDAVKLDPFGYKLSILQLDLIVIERVTNAVDEYIKSYCG